VVIASVNVTLPLQSYGDCLEVNREYYQNCSVLDCVTQCSQSATHLYEQFLQVQQIGFVTLEPCVEAVARSCIIVTWWSGSRGIQAWSQRLTGLIVPKMTYNVLSNQLTPSQVVVLLLLTMMMMMMYCSSDLRQAWCCCTIVRKLATVRTATVGRSVEMVRPPVKTTWSWRFKALSASMDAMFTRQFFRRSIDDATGCSRYTRFQLHLYMFVVIFSGHFSSKSLHGGSTVVMPGLR